MNNSYLKNCICCPRECGADRINSHGFCGANDKIRVARAALHFGEEPCVSGKSGSGTVFFSGCSLKCVFCQNFDISSGNFGRDISRKRLKEIFFELKEKGAHNINLVNPTHYIYQIVDVLSGIKPKLGIPVVYNTSGYEKVESLKLLENLVDVYLPDFKYMSGDLSKKYSDADNYSAFAKKAIKEMRRQTGKIRIDEKGIIQKGTIVRHMVLPGCRKDSAEIIHWLGNNFSQSEILVSVMSQYTPCFKSENFKEINRKITTFEYNFVINEVNKAGFNGFMQEKQSATLKYTPKFDLTGV